MSVLNPQWPDVRMNEQLKEKANEISLMLMMASESDIPGLKLLLEICDDLAALAAKEPSCERLVAAVKFLRQNENAPELFSLLQGFATDACNFLENSPDVRFANEKNPTATTNADLGESIDQRFLAEYIETHTLLLEDFESSLLDFQNTQDGGDELGTTIKRYIHNLKGDSGSIGLVGIEKACHALEDLLIKTPATSLIPQLLSFKQWVIQSMLSYAEGTTPTQTSIAFIQGMRESVAPSPVDTQKIDAVKPIEQKAEPTAQPSSDEYKLTGENDILLEFAAEAEEHLNNVESVILDSEGEYSRDSIDTIFRGVHSLKGGSAYFALEEMTKCSHILENFLSEVRDGKRILDQRLSALLLTYIDLQKDVLARAKDVSTKDGVMKRSEKSVSFLSSLEAYGKGAADPVEVSVANASSAPAVTKADSSPSKKQSDTEPDAKAEKLNLKTFVKVDTGRLDLLIDSIGEMVIYSSMLIKNCRDLLNDNESVMEATHRVEKFTRDLQDIGMSMRLDPIKGLFQKMSRLVWDTSKKLGKDIVFSMEGEDTELDRNLIDKLADPLMHMVRNSLDHGIEPPDEREKKGKSRSGKVKLSAYHAGGSIHIKIQDDGRGLNAEKLIAKAVEKGIIQEGQKLSDTEAFQLIFAAGFSTAAVVTDISGRGVGMDVVRRNVESLRGRITIESQVDKGSTFTIELPLTLAIIDGIQVQVGSEAFILPSLSIVEFIKPKASMISNALDHGETLHFRGSYLPIYRISSLYDLTPRYDDLRDATLAIVENNHEQVALVVDEILGECSTVIKSLGSMFGENKGLAGCAIMPQGNVALILDIRSFVQLARKEYRHRSTHEIAPTSPNTQKDSRPNFH